MNCPDTFRKSLSAVAASLLGLLAACHPTSPSDKGTALNRALGGEPSTLDPRSALDNFSAAVLMDLYEGLTAESPTGTVVPGVAESWAIDRSGTKYTFQLRSNARWSNGKQVRAQDFVTAWRSEIDPKFGSPVADDLRLIAHAAEILEGKKPPAALGVSAPSDSILVVNLERPAPYFLQMLTHSSTFPIYSEEATRSHGGNTWVSNGPYAVTEWLPGTELRLNRNAYYWDEHHVSISQVNYYVVPDENTQFSRYRAGQIDITDIVPINAVPGLRAQGSKELFLNPFLCVVYYGFNLSSPPLASNVKLRQALAMAINRRRLIQSLGFVQAPAYGFVPPGTSDYSSQSWEWSSLSDEVRVARAKQLYTAAGYSQRSPLRLRVLLSSNISINSTAIVIASMWKEVLGVESELMTEEFRVFLNSRHDKTRWDVARLAWTADYNDASNFLDIFRTNSVNNDMSYRNPSVDVVLDQAGQTANRGERRAILETVEQTILADYPIIPLYFLVSKRLVKPYVLGVQPNPLNRIASKTLVLSPH